jgi:hypothetical protein
MIQENKQGRLGFLTAQQTETLSQFKKELEQEGYYNPEKHSDHLLLMFLRARQFGLAAAKEMWIKNQNWRKEFGTDTVAFVNSDS